MLLITFPAELSVDLDLTQKLSTPLFQDFLKLAIDLINGKPAATKIYNKAAQQLEVEPTVVEKCIKGLGLLFVNCAKKNASTQQFAQAIGEFALTDEQTALLREKYDEINTALRSTLHLQTKTGEHFESFDWRLDVEISSRSCRNIFKPVYVCQLTTKNESENSTHTNVLQCDYSILNRMHDELAIAINESKTPHARRIQRYVK
jgi:hypothetical protein